MVDFTTPNLCGSSESFNKLAGQFASIKDSLQGQLEGEIDTLKSELTSSLSVLEADIKGLIPELPDIPDVSLISEVQNFLALPAGSPASLNALTSLTSQFGEGITAAGQSLDSIISSASSAFSGGIDLCGGTIPNFVIGSDGSVKEKPQDSGIPDKDPTAEAGATITTPVAEITIVNAPIQVAVQEAVSKFKAQVTKVRSGISSEAGELSNALKEEYDKADLIAEAAAIKAKVPTNPQTAKVKDAVSTNKTLPPKEPVIKPVNLTADELIEIEGLKELQDAVSDYENNVIGEFERLSHLLLKHTKKFPENIIADGERKIVNNKKNKSAKVTPLHRSTIRSFFITGLYKYFKVQINIIKKDFQRLNKGIDRRRDLILRGKTDTVSTDNLEKLTIQYNKIIEGPRESASKQTGNELLESMDKAFTDSEKAYTVSI